MYNLTRAGRRDGHCGTLSGSLNTVTAAAPSQPAVTPSRGVAVTCRPRRQVAVPGVTVALETGTAGSERRPSLRPAGRRDSLAAARRGGRHGVLWTVAAPAEPGPGGQPRSPESRRARPRPTDLRVRVRVHSPGVGPAPTRKPFLGRWHRAATITVTPRQSAEAPRPASESLAGSLSSVALAPGRPEPSSRCRPAFISLSQ